MKQRILSVISVVAIIALNSCTVTEEDPDLATEIIGSYTMTSYVTASGASSNLQNEKVTITKVDDTHVDVLIDYSDPTETDVELSNVFVETATSGYALSREFSNATVEGTVIGDDLTLDLTYTSGSYVNIEATK